MAGLKYDDPAFNELTYPAADTDSFLIGRTSEVFRADRRRIVTLAPRVQVNRPQAADFSTWVNQGTATITDLEDGVLLHAAQDPSDNLRCVVRALPSTSAFDIRLGCVRGSHFKNFLTSGLILRESATGKIETVVFSRPGQGNVATTKWNSPTSFNDIRTSWDLGDTIVHFRITLASGTLREYFSVDGVTWLPFDTTGHAVNNFFTTGPNQWGFAVSAINQSVPNMDCDLSVFHWQE